MLTAAAGLPIACRGGRCCRDGGHASKPGNRLSMSVRACGHRLTGGDLQRFSSCVIHSTVGFPGVRCGYTSSSAEHWAHSMDANLGRSLISRSPSGAQRTTSICGSVLSTEPIADASEPAAFATRNLSCAVHLANLNRRAPRAVGPDPTPPSWERAAADGDAMASRSGLARGSPLPRLMADRARAQAV